MQNNIQTTEDSINFLAHFPKHIHKRMHANQRSALTNVQDEQSSVIEEMPTGSGKTAFGYTILRALRAHYGDGTYFFVTPNKALVDQIKHLYPEFHVVYGRNEYDCYYYEEPKYKADQIPCSFLTDCPHRVSQETGETFEQGAHRCPYLDAKWQARQSTLVVCTMSFYLFTTLFKNQWGEIKGVVVDEAHRMPDIIREALSYEITDYHLNGIVEFLKESNIDEWRTFNRFLKQMKTAVGNHSPENPLLEEREIHAFINTLGSIKRTVLEKEIKRVLSLKRIEDQERLEFIKKLEMIIRDLHRYMASFEYSLDTDSRRALNYTYAYLKPRKTEQQRVEHVLYVKCYHVPPIVKRIFPEDRTFLMSATIGNIEAFRMETGLQYPFFTHDSEFPVENTRIYLPSDVEDLSVKHSRRNSKSKTARRIAKACRKFAGQGFRSLVLVVSDQERDQFLKIAESENVKVLTYNKDLKPKACVQEFKNGKGEVLLGTFAQYGEGIDLPDQAAPVTFALRPAYPPPNDPKSLYEERRFKNGRWIIWMAKEMRRILQARGRNVRSVTDRGVTFCMSSQYKKIVLRSLPKWLEKAYVYTKSFDEAVVDALKLLKKK